jgi:hypothetical protein
MAITRLSGGLTPGNAADPRTFPAIWNSTADDIEAGDYSLVQSVNGATGTVVVNAVGTADAPITYDAGTQTVGTDGSLQRLGRGRPKTGTTTFYAPLCAAPNQAVAHAIGGPAPRLRYGAAVVPTTINITEALASVITAAVGATIDYYISDADADWQPISSTGRTVATGIDASTTGAKEITGLDITLSPGRYLIIMVTSEQPTVRLWGSMVADAGAMTSAISQNPSNIYVRSEVGSTIDDPWVSTVAFAGGGQYSPLIFRWTYA